MNKVWGFNCYGVCIVRIAEDKIEEWNNNHSLVSEKIHSWKK